MWYPSRMDIENCPLDYFVIKYIHGLEPEQMPPANAKMRSGSTVESCVADILQGEPEQEARQHWQHVLDQHFPIHDKD